MLSSSPPFGVLISPVIPIASIREQLTATQWSPQFLSAVQGASAARGGGGRRLSPILWCLQQWLRLRQRPRQRELGRHKFGLTATQVSLLSRHLPLTGINIPAGLITKDIRVAFVARELPTLEFVRAMRANKALKLGKYNDFLEWNFFRQEL